MITDSNPPPLLVFPCDYPIKVIGDTSADFKAFVYQTVLRYDPSLSEEAIELKPSRNGNFTSARVTFYATSKDQISALFQDLKTNLRVKMVL